jgi:malate synthase
MLDIRRDLKAAYADLFTTDASEALHALAPLDDDRKAVMTRRIARRAARARDRKRIAFLDPSSEIPRTRITVADARAGRFEGSEIPADLQRQWIQGTGPGAKPNVPIDQSIRNVAP